MTGQILPTIRDIDNVTFWTLAVLLVAAGLTFIPWLLHTTIGPLFDRLDEQRIARERLERRHMAAVVRISDRRPS